MRTFATLAIAGALVACGAHHGGSDATLAFDRIEVDPPQATLTVPLGGSAMQAYTVTGIASDGTRTDITSACTLALDSSFGTAAGPTVTVGPHGGKTPVTAVCSDKAGTAELIVNVTGDVVVSPAPPGSPGLFGGATLGVDPAHTPVIQYPLDKAVSPRNIPTIETQWAASGNDLFHVNLATTFASVDVYTTDVQATLAQTDWAAVVGTAAGDRLAITVEGLVQAAPTTKYAAAVSIKVSLDEIDSTAIYYWASSQGNIMQQTFGVTTPPGLVKNGCTSCHSVSRTASRIGYSRCVANDCGQLYGGFMKFDATTQTWVEMVNADSKSIQFSYSTFAPVGNPFPDDTKSLAIVTMSNGTLQLVDPDTGATVPSNIDVSAHGPGAPRTAMMADWSADGTKVVFTSTPHPGQWIDLSDGSIATMTYTYQNGQHVFGEPQFIGTNPMALPNGSYSNFFFPSFSPDGALIVFDGARTAWRNSGSAKGAGSRLLLADGAGTWVQDLRALNGGDTDQDITWAHWAPADSAEYYWMVFSSERDYGHEATAANANPACKNVGVVQCKQIWIGAIARNQLGGTVDPSAPPMWLPGQDTQADNISPYWSVPAGLQ